MIITIITIITISGLSHNTSGVLQGRVLYQLHTPVSITSSVWCVVNLDYSVIVNVCYGVKQLPNQVTNVFIYLMMINAQVREGRATWPTLARKTGKTWQEATPPGCHCHRHRHCHHHHYHLTTVITITAILAMMMHHRWSSSPPSRSLQSRPLPSSPW